MPRRLAGLLSRSKAAEGRAVFAEAQLAAVLDAIACHPELHAMAVAAAFTAGLQALADADGDVARALRAASPELGPEAARVLMQDTATGARVVARLATDRELAARISALPAVEQAIEVGRLAQSLAPARRSSKPAPAEPHAGSIFELFNPAFARTK